MATLKRKPGRKPVVCCHPRRLLIEHLISHIGPVATARIFGLSPHAVSRHSIRCRATDPFFFTRLKPLTALADIRLLHAILLDRVLNDQKQ